MKHSSKSEVFAIEIHQLEKTYSNGFIALKGIDLSIPKGSFFALLGPNGAGKSTTIGCITSLIRATKGTVRVGGFDISAHPVEAKSRLGVVAQEFNFGIFDTIIDILLGQAGYYGISRTKGLPIAERNLKNLGLWEKRNDQARTLSGGMKRRLMIARALMHEPEVLILDEPTAGVDIELRRGMWDFLRELNAKGVTIVLTTHYLEEAEALCNRVAIINKWEIVREGTMKSLLSGLDQESYLIDTVETCTPEQLKGLKAFHPLVDENSGSIEITLRDNVSVDAVTRKFQELGLTIHRLRNKTNRLEELFIQLTR